MWRDAKGSAFGANNGVLEGFFPVIIAEFVEAVLELSVSLSLFLTEFPGESILIIGEPLTEDTFESSYEDHVFPFTRSKGVFLYSFEFMESSLECGLRLSHDPVVSHPHG